MNWHSLILDALKILVVLLLVLTNGFFVAAEFALVRIRETQLDALVARGQRGARMARHIVHNLNSYLSATQLGITMASLGLGWIGEPVFAAMLEPLMSHLGIQSLVWQHSIAFTFGFTALTFLHITAGELAPKWLTIQKPLPVALWAATPLRWFYLAFYPFNRLLNYAARWLLEKMGIEPDGQAEGGHSEEELRVVLAGAQKTSDGRGLVLNALDLRHRIAREVMRPRHEIVVFDTDADLKDCLKIAERSRYSRFPICLNGDPSQSLGVVHIKDLYAQRDKAQKASDLLPVARHLIYVPETARLDRLLRRFLEKKTHFAMVVDEYGITLGIVTLENVMEALVGQIQDEFDEEKTQLIQRSKNVWEVDGGLSLHELEKIIGPVPHDETVTTTSGWVTQKLGGFPRSADTIQVGDCELRVEELDGTRVSRLKVTRTEPPAAPPEI
jgi:CBS domain containing-hemolysin-like protein